MGLSPIFLEWRRLYENSFRNGNELWFSDETIAGWRAMWERYIKQMPLIALDVWDAYRLCIFGYEIALQEGDYDAAAERLALWLRHPAARFVKPDTPFRCRAKIATARLCAGHTADSVAIYRHELEGLSRYPLTCALTFLSRRTHGLPANPPPERNRPLRSRRPRPRLRRNVPQTPETGAKYRTWRHLLRSSLRHPSPQFLLRQTRLYRLPAGSDSSERRAVGRKDEG